MNKKKNPELSEFFFDTLYLQLHNDEVVCYMYVWRERLCDFCGRVPFSNIFVVLKKKNLILIIRRKSMFTDFALYRTNLV